MLVHDGDREIYDQVNALTIKIAGVTFSNPDGSRRQTILRRCKWHDEPYAHTEDEVNLEFRPTEFEGAPAVEIWIEDDNCEFHQIGYVPREYAAFFVSSMDYYDGYYDFEVYGGGNGKSYGASVTVHFRNTPEDQRKYDEAVTAEEAAKKAAAEAEAAVKEKTIALQRAAEEAREKPYRRAFELFCLDYLRVRHGGYVKVTKSKQTSINIVDPSGTRPLYQVFYYADEDTISVYTHPNGDRMRPRAHGHRVKRRLQVTSWPRAIICGAALLALLYLLIAYVLFYPVG